jgi:hypothetical protein
MTSKGYNVSLRPTMGASRVSWSDEGAFFAPAVSATQTNQSRGNAQPLTPFTQGFTFTAQNNNAVTPAITGLLARCTPLHVMRLIVSVIVDPVQAVLLRRPSPYMYQKFCIRGELKLNPPSAIVAVIASAWVGASRFGGIIGTVFGTIPRLVVRCILYTSLFADRTPARPGRPPAQGGAIYAAYCATRTFAPPSARHLRQSEHSPRTEGFATQIYKPGIARKRCKNDGIFVMGHVMFSFTRNHLEKVVATISALWRLVLILPNGRLTC